VICGPLSDPENTFGHDYNTVKGHQKNGQFTNLGQLEPGFPAKLKAAILGSVKLSNKNKERMMGS
jgi:hypothetical protein